jgi:hypothetical protein
MNNRPLVVLLGILVVAQIAGFALLWWQMEVTRTPPPAPTLSVAPGTLTGAVQLENEDLLRESIRNVVQQELEAFRIDLKQEITAGSGPDRALIEAPKPAAPRLPAGNRAAVVTARAVVDRALAAGVWTDADNAEILRQAPRLTEAQRTEILDRIFGAINNQQLKAIGSLPSL